jgi:hypothetical protein
VSALADQIAEVLKTHRWMAFDMSWDVCTGCDWRGKNRDDHAAHVAERIAELFTEEHGYQIDGEQRDEPDAWFPAADYNTSRPVTHRRFVSPWTAEETNP